MWDIVIMEKHHEDQIFASTSNERLNAQNKDVRYVKLLITTLVSGASTLGDRLE
jgi:hypothetical protein